MESGDDDGYLLDVPPNATVLVLTVAVAVSTNVYLVGGVPGIPVLNVTITSQGGSFVTAQTASLTDPAVFLVSPLQDNRFCVSVEYALGNPPPNHDEVLYTAAYALVPL